MEAPLEGGGAPAGARLELVPSREHTSGPIPTGNRRALIGKRGPVKAPRGCNHQALIDWQALVSLKIKQTIDAEVCRPMAVIIEVG